MKKFHSCVLLTGILLICGSLSFAQERISTRHNLMPAPASVSFDNERLAIDESFKVAIRGHSDARLQAAVFRFVKRLEGRTVLSSAESQATIRWQL